MHGRTPGNPPALPTCAPSPGASTAAATEADEVVRDNLTASALDDTLSVCHICNLQEIPCMQGKVRLLVEKEYTLEQIRQADSFAVPAYKIVLKNHTLYST